MIVIAILALSKAAISAPIRFVSRFHETFAIPTINAPPKWTKFVTARAAVLFHAVFAIRFNAAKPEWIKFAVQNNVTNAKRFHANIARTSLDKFATKYQTL